MATETITCPSGLKLTIRNMKAREMALLADDGSGDEDGRRRAAKKRVVRKSPVTSVLQGTVLEVVDVGPYAPWGASPGVIATPSTPGPGRLPLAELLLCDRFFALTRVRACTWGDLYEFRVRCREKTCIHHKRPFLWGMDLGGLEVKDLPAASRKKVAEKDLTFSFKLGGKTAKFKLQQGLDEFSHDFSETPKARIFLAQCASRLTYLEGVDVTDFEGLMDWVEDLDLPEILDATRFYDEVDGGIETNTIAVCPNCRLEFDVAVPFELASFLLPDRKTPDGKPMAEPTS